VTVVKGLELLPGDEKKALLKLVKNAVAGLAACPTGGAWRFKESTPTLFSSSW